MNKKKGRPAGSTKPDNEIAKKRTIRLTDLENSNYIQIGGAKWLRPILRNPELVKLIQKQLQNQDGKQ